MHNIAMPSFRLMTFEVHANTRTALLIMISIRVSTILSIRNPTGLIAAAIPSTSKMLKMLEPITFPVSYTHLLYIPDSFDILWASH